MRIRYIGQHESTETFGKTFYRYKWVNVDLDPTYEATLAQNPQFEVEAVIEGAATEVVEAPEEAEAPHEEA